MSLTGPGVDARSKLRDRATDCLRPDPRVADHERRVELVREAARQAGRYVGVLGDLTLPTALDGLLEP